MADARRIDERIEFSLSSRSAVALVAGGGLVLVLVFALGVLLGRQLARPPTAARPVVARSDKNLVAEETEDGELSFTFHERLVSDRDSPLRAAAAPRPVPAKPAAKPSAEPAVAKAKPEVVPTAAQETDSTPRAERPVAAAEGESDPDLPLEAVADKSVSEKDTGHESPSPHAQAEIGETADAAGTVKTEVEAPTPEAAARTTPSPPSPTPSARSNEVRWSVQFGAAPNREDAERLQEQLLSQGVPAFIVEVDLPEKGRFFRVRAGRFVEKTAAEKMRAEARALGFDGIVMR